MRRIGRAAVMMMTLVLGFAGQTVGARQAPNPQEVYELIRTNLPGITDAQLQTAAVEGLVRQLQPRVWLAAEAPASGSPTAPALARTTIYAGPTAYFRIGSVRQGLAQALEAAYQDAARSNHLQGLVLDLRYADGEDYAAAGHVADLFIPDAQALLDWGGGSARSTAKTNAWRLPVAVLVNRETRAAAEALAAVLREVGAALIIGTNTAGRALITEGFKLQNGQELRIARAGIRLGGGTTLSAEGVPPDIAVAVSDAEERVAWNDPLTETGTGPGGGAFSRGATNTAAASTNRISSRLNEATLVRERSKRGSPAGTVKTVVAAEPAPTMRDAALARALDLIKALALVKELRTK